MQTFTAFSIAFLAAFLSTFLFRRMALALQILDIPNDKKIHTDAVPLLGGLGIYLGTIVTYFVFPLSFKSIMPIFIGGTVILYMGTYDDIKGLSAKFRLLVQIIMALFVIRNGVQITFLPENLWGRIIEYLITVIWIVGVTNAFNYLDGLDGLAAGSAATIPDWPAFGDFNGGMSWVSAA